MCVLVCTCTCSVSSRDVADHETYCWSLLMGTRLQILSINSTQHYLFIQKEKFIADLFLDENDGELRN